MTLRHTLPVYLLILTLTLTGCFRAADDDFESIDSIDAPASDSTAAIPTIVGTLVESPTELPITTEAESAAADATATEGIVITVDTQAADATAEPLADDTTADSVPTETVVLFIATETEEPATNTPPPSPTTADTLATATQPTIITPQPPPAALPITPAQAVEETEEAVEAEITDDASDADTAALPSTPTALPGSGECDYVVRNGDNPFRIALNNNVTLAELLAANSLPNDPILQPGQVLIIPNCTESQTATPGDATSAPQEGSDSDTASSGDFIVHVVTSGETLSGIASRYGVTIAEIVAENDLANPDSLSVGQQLRIPD